MRKEFHDYVTQREKQYTLIDAEMHRDDAKLRRNAYKNSVQKRRVFNAELHYEAHIYHADKQRMQFALILERHRIKIAIMRKRMQIHQAQTRQAQTDRTHMRPRVYSRVYRMYY